MHFILIIGVLLAVIFGPSWWVRRVMARYSEPADRYPGTGGELVNHLARQLKIPDLGVERTEQGDHYDPEAKVVRLTDDKYDGRSLTAITVAEVFHGVRRLADGRRKVALEAAALRMFEEDFAQGPLVFDHAAALVYADVVVQRERAGRPISTADAQIAAITRQHAASLATRNVRDFDGLGLDLIDPWSAAI